MMLRQGRKNGHNLYLQLGNEPSDQDVSLGYIAIPEVAREIVDGCNNQMAWDVAQALYHEIGLRYAEEPS